MRQLLPATALLLLLLSTPLTAQQQQPEPQQQQPLSTPAAISGPELLTPSGNSAIADTAGVISYGGSTIDQNYFAPNVPSRGGTGLATCPSGCVRTRKGKSLGCNCVLPGTSRKYGTPSKEGWAGTLGLGGSRGGPRDWMLVPGCTCARLCGRGPAALSVVLRL